MSDAGNPKPAQPAKQCAACEALKPLEGGFSRNSKERDGYRASCKDCERERRRAKGAKARADVKAAVDEFEVTWEEPTDVAPLPPPVQRAWEPSNGLDLSGPGLPRKGMDRVLCLGDIHFPWHSHRGIRLVLELLDSERYDVIVQLGDLYDLLSLSKYPRSQNLLTPKDETDEGRRWAVWFWGEVRKRQPRARLVQLAGNHDKRAERRVIEHLPAIEHLAEPTIRELYRFEGVQLEFDDRAEFEHQGVLYHHGHRTFGRHVSWNLMPTVNGHLHRGGLITTQTQRGTIWELNCGWLGNFEAPCFGYVPQKRVHGTTLGVGEVDERGPRFCPF